MNGLKVRESKIHGKGLFANKEFNEGDLIGIAHINGNPTGMIGRFHNHSDKPNAHSVSFGNKKYLAALRPLMKGEEITVDYRRQPDLEQPEDFKKFQDGGITSQEEIDAANNTMMKARLAYAYMHGNPAAQRMVVAPDQPYDFGDGNTGTHYMASMDNYAVPQIQDVNGQLMLGDYGPESAEAIRFDTDEDAMYFAENYKDVSPAFLNQKQKGGESKKRKKDSKGRYRSEDGNIRTPITPEMKAVMTPDEWGQYVQEVPEVYTTRTKEEQALRNYDQWLESVNKLNILRPTQSDAIQPANWVFAAPMVAPMALEALGSVAATQIPGTGVSLGTAANIGFGIHGATQVPQRIQDWQDVAAGKKDWREATAESLMTGLELYGGLSELKGFKGVPKELPGSPNSSLELGKASKTIYPQPITNSVGLKQFGQTTYSGPVSVNRTFKGDIYSIKNVRNPEGIPEEQIPYLLGREELMRRYPTDYMSKDELIGYNFKSGLKPVEYPTEIPANFTTQEDIMARILGKPLPSRAKPKVYYDLEGNAISEEEAIRILNTREYVYGGFINRSKLNRFTK